MNFLPEQQQIGAGVVSDHDADIMTADRDIVKVGVYVSYGRELFESQSPAARAGPEAAEKEEKENGGEQEIFFHDLV